MNSSVALILALTFAIARAPYHYEFPRDHFAHDSYRTEWWYYTGHVKTRDGKRFGYELTFFRFALVPHARRIKRGQSDWRAAQLYPAHFAITAESEKRFSFVEKLGREALGASGASESALNVWVDDWRLFEDRRSGRFAMHVRATSGGEALDLALVPAKPPAIHGSGGVSRKGPCSSCASHYYSFTRLITSGTLTDAGRRSAVDGISWMDHEFGSDELMPDQRGWDWFSMQFFDGRDAMIYRLRQRDGSVTPQSGGSLIERGGRVTVFPFARVRLTEESHWTSPHTSATYPSGWVVRVPGVARDIRVTPSVADQELVDPNGELTYWEGAVDLRDAQTGRALGVGYVELTGYASGLRI